MQKEMTQGSRDHDFGNFVDLYACQFGLRIHDFCGSMKKENNISSYADVSVF